MESRRNFARCWRFLRTKRASRPWDALKLAGAVAADTASDSEFGTLSSCYAPHLFIGRGAWSVGAQIPNQKSIRGRRLYRAHLSIGPSWRHDRHFEKLRCQLSPSSFRDKLLGDFLRRDKSPSLPSIGEGRAGLVWFFRGGQIFRDLRRSPGKGLHAFRPNDSLAN